MKALEILKEISTKCETDENFMGYTYDAKKVDKLIHEAIAELEEAMKPKTCYVCKQSWEPNNQTFHKYFCEYLKIPIHGNFCCNRYEPKDNA